MLGIWHFKPPCGALVGARVHTEELCREVEQTISLVFCSFLLISPKRILDISTMLVNVLQPLTYYSVTCYAVCIIIHFLTAAQPHVRL